MTRISSTIAAVAIAVAGAIFSTNAGAQQINVNCAALNGSPMMCVKNATSAPVVAVQATSNMGFNPTSWINIPGGPIMPGGTSIVRFPTWAGGCNQYVSIRLADGRTHTYPFTNVCSSTSFTVQGW